MTTPPVSRLVARDHIDLRSRAIKAGNAPPVPTRPRERLLCQLLGPRMITDHQTHAAHDLAVAFAEGVLERHPHVSITRYEPARTAKV